MEINLPLDFKEFLKLLNEKGVRYLLIGAMQLDITAILAPQVTWMYGLPSILRMRKKWSPR